MTSLLRPRVIFTLLAVIAGGALAWFSYFSPALSQNEFYFSKESGQSPNLGTNKDGQEDWEEVLRKTAQNSNEKSPNDEDLGQPPNLTDAFSGALARSLGPRILAEGGLEKISLSDIQAAATYLPNAEAILGDPEKITIDQIRITEKNDNTSIKKYFVNIFEIYKKTFFTLKEDDLMILGRALSTENYSELNKLDAVIAAFSESAAQIKKISVPRGWEDFTMREIEYLNKTKQILVKFKNTPSDPTTTLILLPRRVSLMEEIKKFHNETGAALKTKGVIFEQSEGAYKLFH